MHAPGPTLAASSLPTSKYSTAAIALTTRTDPCSLTRPQLLAVSATSNRQKGDGDPAEWLPAREDYQCEYVRAWIQVKQYYGLSVDMLEKAALSNVLNNVC